jgi:hypothetical protein
MKRIFYQKQFYLKKETTMTPQTFSDFIGDHQYAKILLTCYDCEKDFEINVERTGPKEIKITGGAIWEARSEWDSPERFLGKCQGCFDSSPGLAIPTSIYSRVVGYMRPVSGWNKAKQEEFVMRKTFRMEGSAAHPE